MWSHRILNEGAKSIHSSDRTTRSGAAATADNTADPPRANWMRRAKTDLSEADLGPRSRLPIFMTNENAKVWLDLNQKSSSLDDLDKSDDEAGDNSKWRHYVNVAPPRPPKSTKMEIRRSTPVYVNVYSLGRRKPGDIIQTGR